MSRLELFHILVLLVYVNFKCELLLAVKRSAAIVDRLLLTVAFGMHEKTLKFVVLCERITTSLYLLCNCLVSNTSFFPPRLIFQLNSIRSELRGASIYTLSLSQPLRISCYF